MNPQKPPSELRAALWSLKPYFVRASWFSLIASILVLAPSGYMLEVYDRVVNSRSHATLVMLTLLVLGVVPAVWLGRQPIRVLSWRRALLGNAALATVSLG